MAKEKKQRNIVALTGAAAVAVVALYLAISAINSHRSKKKKKALLGSNVRVNLTAILKLADEIVAKSIKVHDAVGSVPLDKVIELYLAVMKLVRESRLHI